MCKEMLVFKLLLELLSWLRFTQMALVRKYSGPSQAPEFAGQIRSNMHRIGTNHRPPPSFTMEPTWIQRKCKQTRKFPISPNIRRIKIVNFFFFDLLTFSLRIAASYWFVVLRLRYRSPFTAGKNNISVAVVRTLGGLALVKSEVL